MARVAAHCLYETEAVEPRHVDVGDDDLWRIGLQDLEPVHAVLRLGDPEAGADQRHPQHVAHGAGIIDGKYGHAHCAAGSMPS